jgi:hypothetical protein
VQAVEGRRPDHRINGGAEVALALTIGQDEDDIGPLARDRGQGVRRPGRGG